MARPIKGNKAKGAGAKSDKEWRREIMLAVNDLRKDPDDKKKKKVKAIRLLARRIVTAGIEGDISAIKEIGDRLDGKPTTFVAGDDDAPPIQITAIERVIVDPAED